MTALRRIAGLLALLAAVALAVPASAQTPTPTTASIGRTMTLSIVEVAGGIDSSYADYIRGEVAAADQRGDLAIVFMLSSSVVVKTDLESLVARVRDARVPVVTWVAHPQSTDAAVAGGVERIWAAGDLRLLRSDSVVRGLTPQPLTGAQAVDAGQATGVAESLLTVIAALREPPLSLQFDAAGADVAVRNANPNLWIRVKHALATNSTLVYLLILTGAAAIVFELFQPGFGPAGWAGLFLLAVAAIGLAGLPTNPLGLVLLAAGLGLFALDVARGGLGPITWAGTALLVAGSLTMVHGDVLDVPLGVVIGGVVGAVLYYVVVMTLVLRSLRGPLVEFGPSLVGKQAQVKSTLNPQGHILVDGALWRARASGKVAVGTAVTVTGYDPDALVLDVAVATAAD